MSGSVFVFKVSPCKDAVRRVSRCTGFFDNVMIPINSSSIIYIYTQYKYNYKCNIYIYICICYNIMK